MHAAATPKAETKVEEEASKQGAIDVMQNKGHQPFCQARGVESTGTRRCPGCALAGRENFITQTCSVDYDAYLFASKGTVWVGQGSVYEKKEKKK